MAKQKYEVVIPFFGAEAGKIVEFEGEINPAFRANLRKLPDVLSDGESQKSDEKSNSEKWNGG